MTESQKKTLTALSPIAIESLERIGEAITERRVGSGRAHHGIDLFAPVGTAVRAAMSGMVLRVINGSEGSSQSKRRAGWFVDVIGDDRLVYRYLHLADRPSVRDGQRLKRGALIGTLGTSGVMHSKPHLHFEIRSGDFEQSMRRYGAPVDPFTILPSEFHRRRGTLMASNSRQDRPLPHSSEDHVTAVSYLVSKGWTSDQASQFLLGKVSTEEQVQSYLASLGWTQGDIARLLAGPEKSHLTAESLYRKYAATPPSDQSALVGILKSAGASDVKTDSSTISGIDSRQLKPDKPLDLNALLQQFAQLPEAQQKRFLALLDAQKPPKKDSTSASSSSDVIYGPLIKGGVDAATLALKRLLEIGKGDKGTSGGSQPSAEKPVPQDTDKAVIQDKDDTAPLPEDLPEENTESSPDDGEESGGSEGTEGSDGGGGIDGQPSTESEGDGPTGADGGETAPSESEPD